MYDEAYENASTFIHHPQYHTSAFQLICHNRAGFNANDSGRWIFSSFNNESVEIIPFPNIGQIQASSRNVTSDGIMASVTFMVNISSSEVTLTVDPVKPGNFVCQSDNNFDLHLRVVTGTYVCE